MEFIRNYLCLNKNKYIYNIFPNPARLIQIILWCFFISITVNYCNSLIFKCMLFHLVGILNIPSILFKESSIFNGIFSLTIFPILIYFLLTKNLYFSIFLIFNLFFIFSIKIPDLFTIILFISSFILILIHLYLFYLFIINKIINNLNEKNKEIIIFIILTKYFSLNDINTNLYLEKILKEIFYIKLKYFLKFLIKFIYSYFNHFFNIIIKSLFVVIFLTIIFFVTNKIYI